MLSKADAEAVRSQNRRLVIDHFRRNPVSTRRRMSDETGLSLSTASAIASDMLRSSLLVELEPAERAGRRGRPEVSLQLFPEAARVAALTVAVGGVGLTLADYTGAILADMRREIDLSSLSEPELVGAVLALFDAEELTAARGPGQVRQVVVSVQGVTDSGNRRIVWSPILKPRGIDLASPIEAARGAPTRVLNDCGLMPERFRWGGEIDAQDFATVYIGSGVGMGLRLGGRTFRGAHSSAVEFGHLNHIPGGDLCRCGNRGCIEAYAGDYAIWRAAKGDAPGIFEKPVRPGDMRELGEAARAGDAAARLAFERAGEAVGYGLGRVFTLIDPLPVVFVGTGTEAMDLMEPAIRKGIADSAIDGSGADTPFTVMPDVHAITVEAAIALGLAALDEEFSKAPSTTLTEAA